MFICATYRAHQRAGLPFCHFAILPFLVPEFKSNASITRKHGGGTLQTLQTAYKRACGGTRHAQYGACHRCSTHVHTGGMYERRQESGSKLGTLTVHAHKPLSRHHGRLGQDHVTRSQGQPQARQGVGRHAHGRPLAKDAAQHCTQVQLHTLHILQGGMWGGGHGARGTVRGRGILDLEFFKTLQFFQNERQRDFLEVDAHRSLAKHGKKSFTHTAEHIMAAICVASPMAAAPVAAAPALAARLVKSVRARYNPPPCTRRRIHKYTMHA